MREIFTRATIVTTLLTLGFIAEAAAAHSRLHSGKGQLETCLAATAKIKSGEFVKVEYLNPSAEGVPTYEIEVRDSEGGEWEFLCNARKGHVYEIETEVDSSSDERFKRQAKVSEEQARKTALDLYPGKIQEVEYEIESNGDVTYEFDIVDLGGTEWKVEVDAATGKIIEVHVEEWEIGEEPNER